MKRKITSILLIMLSINMLISIEAKAGYDPTIGRWLSRDPMKNAELSQGTNLYSYVGNDPINAIDPLGLLTLVWVRYPAGLVSNGMPYGFALDAGHILMDVNGHRLDYAPQPNAPTDFLTPNQRHDLDKYEQIIVPLTPAQEQIAMRRIDEIVNQNLRWNMNEHRYCSTVLADVINRTGYTEEPVNDTSPFSVVFSLTGRGGSNDPRFNPLNFFWP